MAKIGVFDSGMGGLSVVQAIQKRLPGNQVLFVNDAKHVPYGNKPPKELLGYVVPILQDLVHQGCQIIVIACNTVSTTLITELRQQISVTLVAMEPMIKPAAEQTKSKIIAVCATPNTLKSHRYQWLKDTYGKGIQVVEPDCNQWSAMIEHGQLEEQSISKTIDDVCRAGADVIVLGCTHYHWIEEEIRQVADGRAIVLQPEQPVIAELEKQLTKVL